MQAKDDASLADELEIAFERWRSGSAVGKEHFACLARDNLSVIADALRRQQSGEAVEQSPLEASPVDVERVAEAMWREESRRASGRDRLVPWTEANPEIADGWRGLARAALAALQSPPVEQPAQAEAQQPSDGLVEELEFELSSGRVEQYYARLAISKAITALKTRTSPETVELLREQLRREVINSPETADFMAAVPLEAAHQRERWGADHDAGKSPFDWFWLIGYLAQKAATASVSGDTEKALHHTISTAAALANWHAALTGADNRMVPGAPLPIQAQADAHLSNTPDQGSDQHERS